MEDDGFVLVKSSNRKLPKKPLHRLISCQAELEPFDLELTLKTVLSARDEMAGSSFWTEVRELLGPATSTGRIRSLYCFGLGHPASLISRHQTALLLLLKEELNIPSEKTLVYDPVLSAEENRMLEMLGFQPHVENSECKISLTDKTLVYMPHCSKQLTNNILYSNWSPQGLSNLVLVSNSLSSVALRTPRGEAARSAQLIARAVDQAILAEIRLPDSFRHADVFNDTALHVFNLAGGAEPGQDWWQVDQPEYDPTDLEYIQR